MKTPCTPKDQVRIIEGHGLSIRSDSELENLFMEYNYYFATGYTLHNRNKNSKKIVGMDSDEMIQALLFDTDLRNKCFGLIAQIELRLKRVIPYVHTMKFQADGYLSSSSFNSGSQVSNFNHSDLLIKIQDAIRSSYRVEAYVPHNMRKYGNLPFWVACELLSLSSISKIYSGLFYDQQIGVFRELDNIRDIKYRLYMANSSVLEVERKDFITWLHLIVLMRNRICHHSRLLNKQYIVTINPCTSHHGIMLQSNTLFAAIYACLFILGKKSITQETMKAFKELFGKYPSVKPDLIGFTADWETILGDLT